MMLLHQVKFTKFPWFPSHIHQPIVEEHHTQGVWIFIIDLEVCFQQVVCIIIVASTHKCENPQLQQIPDPCKLFLTSIHVFSHLQNFPHVAYVSCCHSLTCLHKPKAITHQQNGISKSSVSILVMECTCCGYTTSHLWMPWLTYWKHGENAISFISQAMIGRFVCCTH